MSPTSRRSRESTSVRGHAALLSRGVSALLLSLLLVVAVGCASGTVPAETYCYKVTGAIVHTVDTGMNVAGDLYRAGKLTEAQKSKLVAAHNVYQPAAQAATMGCRAIGSQGDADRMVAHIRAAADKLLEALVAAGVLP